MNTLVIKVCGERGSGKTTLMNFIRKKLTEHEIELVSEICEDINTENSTLRINKRDIKYLQELT